MIRATLWACRLRIVARGRADPGPCLPFFEVRGRHKAIINRRLFLLRRLLPTLSRSRPVHLGPLQTNRIFLHAPNNRQSMRASLSLTENERSTLLSARRPRMILMIFPVRNQPVAPSF